MDKRINASKGACRVNLGVTSKKLDRSRFSLSKLMWSSCGQGLLHGIFFAGAIFAFLRRRSYEWWQPVLVPPVLCSIGCLGQFSASTSGEFPTRSGFGQCQKQGGGKLSESWRIRADIGRQEKIFEFGRWMFGTDKGAQGTPTRNCKSGPPVTRDLATAISP